MSELTDRLARVLDERAGDIQIQDEYYRGERPRLVLADRTLPSYAAIVQQARSPFGELVIDSFVEPLVPSGFRVITTDQGDTDVEADSLAWDIWQASQCDMWSSAGFRAALLHGVSYLMVEPSDDLPVLSFEHPSTTATLTAPGGRTTVAGIKRWTEEGVDVAVIWTADGAETLIRDRKRQAAPWELSSTQLATNTTGQVPLFPLKNRPDLLGGYESDLTSLYTTIDRATQSLADRITTQFFASTKVRYLLGVEPDLDEQGAPRESTLKLATDKLLLIENENAKAGVFDASDLRQFIETARSDVATLAALAKLPVFLLNGDLVNVSREALESLSQGMVSKAEERQTWFAPALSQGMRLALRLAGDTRVDDPRTRVEVVWAPVLPPSPTDTASAAGKLVESGVLSKTAAQEYALGLSPSQIDKFRQYERVDQLAAQGAQVIAGLFQPAAPAVPAPAQPEEVGAPLA